MKTINITAQMHEASLRMESRNNRSDNETELTAELNLIGYAKYLGTKDSKVSFFNKGKEIQPSGGISLTLYRSDFLSGDDLVFVEGFSIEHLGVSIKDKGVKSMYLSFIM